MTNSRETPPRPVVPEIVDQRGNPIGQLPNARNGQNPGGRSAAPSAQKKDKKEPSFDLGAIPELIGKFVLFVRSPSGLVCILFGVLVVIAFKNIEQYSPRLEQPASGAADVGRAVTA